MGVAWFSPWWHGSLGDLCGIIPRYSPPLWNSPRVSLGGPLVSFQSLRLPREISHKSEKTEGSLWTWSWG